MSLKENKDKKTVVKWFEGEQDKVEDNYGNTKVLFTVEEVLEALKKDMKKNKETYRRHYFALVLLEAYMDYMGNPEEFKVILLGN
jgi:hypothetical protein